MQILSISPNSNEHKPLSNQLNWTAYKIYPLFKIEIWINHKRRFYSKYMQSFTNLWKKIFKDNDDHHYKKLIQTRIYLNFFESFLWIYNSIQVGAKNHTNIKFMSKREEFLFFPLQTYITNPKKSALNNE